MMSNTDLTKTGGNTGSHEWKVVPASYKAPTMLLILSMCWTLLYANKQK